jgi:hypothetical protein
MAAKTTEETLGEATAASAEIRVMQRTEGGGEIAPSAQR